MADRWYPRDKEELMLAIDRERAAVWNMISQLTAQEMTMQDPAGWSPKDHLAHLVEWMKSFMGVHLDGSPWHVALGVDQQLTDNFNSDYDPINRVLFERNRFKPRQEVMDDFTQGCSRLYAKLEAMSFEDMMKPRYLDDPEKRPVMNWILGNTTEHFVEHRAYMEKIVNVHKI